jgi:hypothetical protein
MKMRWVGNFFGSYYTIEGTPVKIFLEMTPLGVKTCEESEFDIFEAKKRFLIQGRRIVY